MAGLTKCKPSLDNSLNVPPQPFKSLPLRKPPHKHLSLRKLKRRSLLSELTTEPFIKLDEYEFPSFKLQDFDVSESLLHAMTHQAQAEALDVTAHRPSRWRFLKKRWWKTQLAKFGIGGDPNHNGA